MKKLEASEIPSDFLRTLYLWIHANKPSESAPEEQKTVYYLKFNIAYIYFSLIGPLYHRFITWITRYYPFSLLYQGSLLHANAVKAKNLMRGMETIAEQSGIPIDINAGHLDQTFSVFYGNLEKRVMNKQDTLRKLQDIFQANYGTVYVQNDRIGFRVLVDTNLVV